VKLAALLALASALAFAAPKIVYTKTFPGSNPAYVEITIVPSGDTTYRETPDDDPETLKLGAESAAAIFDLAARLDHFKHPVESGLKVANLGAKVLRWEDGEENHEVKFNYSLDENARTLHDWFERITESERVYLILKRAIRHDRLGVNDAVIAVETEWNTHRLVAIEQILPLLDQVSGNEAFMHIARERAAQTAEAMRAKAKS